MGLFVKNARGELELNFGAAIKYALLAFVLLFGACTVTKSFYTVETGEVAFERNFGTLSKIPQKEGAHMKIPFITDVHKVSNKQITIPITTQAYTSDNQPLQFIMKYTVKLNDDQAYIALTEYNSGLFANQIQPKILEALKEITNKETAEQAIKNRDKIKIAATELAIRKVGKIATLVNIDISDINLSPELEKAIEEKMIEEQNSKKAVFLKDRAKIEADTALITAQGEADAINKKGEALRNNKDVLALNIIERWNGVSPTTLVVNGGNTKSTDMIFPINVKKE